jgi:hypothetical protein
MICRPVYARVLRKLAKGSHVTSVNSDYDAAAPPGAGTGQNEKDRFLTAFRLNDFNPSRSAGHGLLAESFSQKINRTDLMSLAETCRLLQPEPGPRGQAPQAGRDEMVQHER